MLKGEKMNDFVNNTLSMVIIGDKDNQLFDGKIIMNGKNDGFFITVIL